MNCPKTMTNGRILSTNTPHEQHPTTPCPPASYNKSPASDGAGDLLYRADGQCDIGLVSRILDKEVVCSEFRRRNREYASVCREGLTCK